MLVTPESNALRHAFMPIARLEIPDSPIEARACINKVAVSAGRHVAAARAAPERGLPFVSLDEAEALDKGSHDAQELRAQVRRASEQTSRPASAC